MGQDPFFSGKITIPEGKNTGKSQASAKKGNLTV